VEVSGYPDGMNEPRGPWNEGQQVWSRLENWYQDALMPLPDEPESGLRALRALEDSGLVRRLLDQVEFEAVRAARRSGKSWAEIAVKLGVTRQSAWERWRDVDEPASERPEEPQAQQPRGGIGESVRLGVARGRPGSVTSSAAENPERVAREWRKRSTLNVPNVVGMAYEIARKTLYELGLVIGSPDPDGPPVGALGWPDGVVVDQSPESGAKVPPGSVVRLWVERGGGGGGSNVREPRRPLPDPKSGQRMRDEATDDAVS
jgi:PASTA domain-containing protein